MKAARWCQEVHALVQQTEHVVLSQGRHDHGEHVGSLRRSEVNS